MPRKQLITLRQGTAAEWAAANPVLEPGEPAWVTDSGLVKVGDGATAWNSLRLAGSPYTGIPITSGDFVADAGATPAVQNNVPGWSFSAGANEAIVTTFPISAEWETFGIILTWCQVGAGAGNVVWLVEMKDLRLFIDPLSKAPFVTDQMTVAAPGTSLLVTGTAPFTNEPVPAATFGAIHTLRISRLGADGADTLAVPAFVPLALITRDS